VVAVLASAITRVPVAVSSLWVCPCFGVLIFFWACPLSLILSNLAPLRFSILPTWVTTVGPCTVCRIRVFEGNHKYEWVNSRDRPRDCVFSCNCPWRRIATTVLTHHSSPDHAVVSDAVLKCQTRVFLALLREDTSSSSRTDDV